ncbi:MAG: transcriptional repressor [Oscillospiraceae bacterium]|nr:transcriptional repressor [Oscillospiraceae bacterium]
MDEVREKFSRQREMICDYVKKYPVHPTADEVYTALKKDCPNLSLGTVYRNLNLLSEKGQLLKIHVGSGKDRFDSRTDIHAHFICEKCGQVFDVEDESLNGIENRVYCKDRHIVKNVGVVLQGVCRQCSDK